ncbi:MAG: hypothetical protein AAF645_19525, partial [Myxococcota bacterium]
MPTSKAHSRPKRLLLVVSTAWMSYRMSTLAMMGTVDTPGTPSAWLAVFLMNFTVGVLAPMVAWALWRRKGLAVWAVGIAWTVWGLAA